MYFSGRKEVTSEEYESAESRKRHVMDLAISLLLNHPQERSSWNKEVEAANLAK